MHNRLGVDASSTNGDVYRIDKTGQIFQYVGWKRLECKSNTVSISAADFLYRLDSIGYIFKYLPNDSTWLQIDDSGQARSITTGGAYVYKLHSDGSVWKADGSAPAIQWVQIDQYAQNVMIAADGNDLYLLHRDGAIFKFGGNPSQWDRIDDNRETKSIVAGWGNIYQMHKNGSVFKYNGSWWDWLDGYENTSQITAGACGLFQYHKGRDPLIYRYVNPGDWAFLVKLGDGEVITDISAGNDGLYVAKRNGEVLRYDPTTGKCLVIV